MNPKLKKDGTPKRSGGRRENSGKPRKNPLEVLKSVSFSVPQKHLLHFGGKDAFVEYVKMLAEKKFNDAHGVKVLTEQEIKEKAIV